MECILLILIGMFAAICGSIVGLGGGFIIVPSLALLYDLPVPHIVGTSMAVLVFSSVSSTFAYAKQKRIDYKSGMLFSLAMIPGSIIGAWTTNFVTSRVFFISLGLFMLCIVASMMFKPNKEQKFPLQPTAFRTIVDSIGNQYTYSFNSWIGATVAFFVGFISSLFGIGGGSIMVPMMILLLTFPIHIAAATSMFLISISSFIGSLSHLVFDHILWSKVLFLAIGSIVGGQIGAKVAAKLPEKTILVALSTCLTVVAVKLIFK